MTSEQKRFIDTLKYMRGFGGHHESESLPNSLPRIGNTPQKCSYKLYAEQLSGTSFTTPRSHNKRSWVYRILPACVHGRLVPAKEGKRIVADFNTMNINPNQTRWKPFKLPSSPTDFVQGLSTLMGSGSAETKTGLAIHIYAFNRSMGTRVFCNSDGDFLIVPQLNTLHIKTEFGELHVRPVEVCVVPRGMRFQVSSVDGRPARGYICEVFSGHFQLPELGPIGSNGLANAKDFEYPVAKFEDISAKYTLVQKFLGRIFHGTINHSPFNVVAWSGNYLPFKYDMRKFCAVNSVTYDHLDPSIFTVLTVPTNEPGVAALDFVVFPPRWIVQEHTFRPPYFHRNCMSEFMGNICGRYEAKPNGFLPGAASLHSIMMGHGPDQETYERHSDTSTPQEPVHTPNDYAFMFESTYFFRLTPWAEQQAQDPDYQACWRGLQKEFAPENPSSAIEPSSNPPPESS